MSHLCVVKMIAFQRRFLNSQMDISCTSTLLIVGHAYSPFWLNDTQVDTLEEMESIRGVPLDIG
jgi:hypothetical protein